MFLFLSLLLSNPLWAYRQGPIAFDAARYDPRFAEFSLIVAGASEQEAYMVAGHLMLRVKQGFDDYSFDWGVFDPTKEDFFIDYMRGNLNYEHIVRPFYESYRIYQYERRQLTEYPLNLTVTQKQKLIAGLVDWAKPENRVYAYDIVYRNCSTVIGGLVARAVGDKVVRELEKPTDQTIRGTGLSYLAHFPAIEVFTDIVGGPAGERPLQKKDLFYLPVLVPEVFTPIAAYDDSQNELDYKLLGEPRVLLAGDNVGPIKALSTIFTGVFVFICGLLAWTAKRKWNFGRHVWFAFISTFLLLSGFLGGVIFFLRFGANHAFAHGNSQLFFFWPIDVLLIFFYTKASWRKWIRGYAYAHVGMAVLTTLLVWLVPSMYQSLRAAWVLTVPVWLLVCLDKKEA